MTNSTTIVRICDILHSIETFAKFDDYSADKIPISFDSPNPVFTTFREVFTKDTRPILAASLLSFDCRAASEQCPLLGFKRSIRIRNQSRLELHQKFYFCENGNGQCITEKDRDNIQIW